MAQPWPHSLAPIEPGQHVFLEGPAGAGKTSAAVSHLSRMLEGGVPGDAILLLVPQRTLAAPYYQALRRPETPSGGVVSILTVGGLAQRMVDLFWPLAGKEAGFAHPDRWPTFLTLETAQYYMAHLVRPLLEQGLFESLTIDRNRLYSQILDNLNKAAVVGFPYTEIADRLKAAWVGEPGQLRIYEDVQTCAQAFREFCLAHNLLDFSLQMEIFLQRLWPRAECRQYLLNSFRHLIFDNIEEDTPVAHDLVAEWLPHFDSALLIYDAQAGYRRFLGADAHSAYALKDLCNRQESFPEALTVSEAVGTLARRLSAAILGQAPSAGEADAGEMRLDEALTFSDSGHRFYPQMLDWVAETIASLVHDEGLPPGEIAVLAPFLSDALRFSLVDRLAALEVPARSHRPSRSLRDEPAAQCLLTLSALAHPHWGICPSRFDVAYALVQAIQDMDLVRAQILTDILYRQPDGCPSLASFDQISDAQAQERITFRLGERYERLRLGLVQAQAEGEELDHFLSRLFGEVLSQPGFGFHTRYDAGQTTANLIESVQKFRWAVEETLEDLGAPLGKEYLLMVQDGVIAAQYLAAWQAQAPDAVLLAPAYTFLMSNRPVAVQFWLDGGSRAWAERLYQPLTHPYVLSRQWPPGRTWSDLDEVETGREALARLVLGLLRRCRRHVYLGLSDLGEQGYEQRGPLLKALQRVLRAQGAGQVMT